MSQDYGGVGVPLGVATAVLEVNVSQLERAQQQITQVAQRIAAVQTQLTQGDKALQASAAQTLNLLRQSAGEAQKITETVRKSGKQIKDAIDESVATGGRRNTPLLRLVDNKELIALRGFQADLQRLQGVEGKRVGTSQKIAGAQEQQADAAREVLSITERMIAANDRYYAALQKNVALERSRFSGGDNTGTAGLNARIRSQEDPNSAIGQLRNLVNGGQPQQSAGGYSGRAGLNPQAIPTFIQFSVYPAANIARTLGAPGVASGLMTAGDTLGVADAIQPFRAAAVELNKRLLSMGGIFGQLATAGSNVAMKFGASAGGVAASLGGVVAAAAPLVALLVGIAAIFGVIGNAVTDFQDKVQRATDGILEANKEIAEGATSSDIQEGIDRNTRERSLTQESQTAIRQLLLDIANANTTLQNEGITSGTRRNEVFAPLSGRLSQLTGGQFTDASDTSAMMALQSIAGAFGTTITELTQDIAAGEILLTSAGVAENNRLAAAEAAADAEDRLAQVRLSAVQNTENMTNAQLREGVAGFDAEFNRIAQVLGTNTNISAEYRQELIAQLNDLTAQKIVYEGLISPMRDFRLQLAQIPQVIADTAKELGDFLKQRNAMIEDRALRLERQQEDEALQEQRASEDQLAARLRALQDFGRELVDAENEYNRNRGRQIEDFERSEREQREDSDERKNELIEDFNEEEQEREEDHFAKLRKIQTDGRISILEAATRLDARGVFETQRRLRQQIQDTTEAYEEERTERKEKLDETLADIDENLAEQQRKRRDDFNRQLAEQQYQYETQRARRIQDFFARIAQEDQERALRAAREAQDRSIREQRERDDFQRQMNSLLSHYTNLSQIQQMGQSFIEQGWANMFLNLARGMSTPTPQAAGGGTNRFGYTPYAYAMGTAWVPDNRQAMLHTGERVLSASENRRYNGQGGGNTSISVGQLVANIGDIGDRTPREAQDLIADGFEQAMRDFAAQGITMVEVNGGM